MFPKHCDHCIVVDVVVCLSCHSYYVENSFGAFLLLICIRSVSIIVMFLIFYFHFTNFTRRQNNISFIVEASGGSSKSPLAYFFLHLFFLFFLCLFLSFSFFFLFNFYWNCCLCPSSLCQHVLCLMKNHTSFIGTLHTPSRQDKFLFSFVSLLLSCIFIL